MNEAKRSASALRSTDHSFCSPAHDQPNKETTMFIEEKRAGEAIQHPSKQGLLEFVKGKCPFEHYSVGLKQEWA